MADPMGENVVKKEEEICTKTLRKMLNMRIY